MHNIFIICTLKLSKYFPALSSTPFYINFVSKIATPQYSYWFGMYWCRETRQQMWFDEINIVHIIFPTVIFINQSNKSKVISTLFAVSHIFVCIINSIVPIYLDTQIVDKLYKSSVLSTIFRRSRDSHMLMKQNIRKKSSSIVEIIR
jgi:hypothetical protein